MDGTSDSFPRSLEAIDISELRRTTLSEVLIGLFLQPAMVRLLRAVRPIMRVPKLGIVVTRYEDVEEVLRHDDSFEVEGGRIRLANGSPTSPNFLLGMQDDGGCPMRRGVATAGRTELPAKDRGYRDYQRRVMRAFPLDDLKRVADIVEQASKPALDLPPTASRQIEVDAIQRLITNIPIILCREYYGLDIPDPKEFAHYTFLVSRWLFDPAPTSRFDGIGPEASARLNTLIDASIKNPTPGDTILRRLLGETDLSKEKVRVILFGMIVGFVPTCTMAGGHILEMLLARPDFLRAAQAAADPQRGDDEQLKRCLFEAMRFKPLLREPLRICRDEYELAEGKWYSRRFRKGDRVLALTASAMRDERVVERPERFDPNRPGYESLLFGQGLHRCIGAPLAAVQITQMFKPLLQRTHLTRAPGAAGALTTLGPFPEHLFVRFDA
jgi:cytochrome P450